jgi:hypothetical protein
MAVRDRLLRQDLPDEATLRAQLEAELRSPDDSTNDPLIVIERPHATSIHLFGIWSRFDGVDQYVRSRVLLDAFKAAKGEQEALKVTVAMGLTPEEAERMGMAIR